MIDFPLTPMVNELSDASFASYSRLFLATLLPDEVNKVIYFDCDGLILGSLKDLWDVDISDYYCAGVIQHGINDNLKREFWFLDVDNYINAGFLYINLEKWRNENVEEKFIDFLSDHQDEFFFHDQGVINKTFDGEIKILKPKYNLMNHYHDFDVRFAKKTKAVELDAYSVDSIIDSAKNPVFVHFAGRGLGPWVNESSMYFHEFKEYAKMCGCESIINLDEQQKYSKPYMIYKKIRETLSYWVMVSLPSDIAIKRSDKFVVEMVRNEVSAFQNQRD